MHSDLRKRTKDKRTDHPIASETESPVHLYAGEHYQDSFRVAASKLIVPWFHDTLLRIVLYKTQHDTTYGIPYVAPSTAAFGPPLF